MKKIILLVIVILSFGCYCSFAQQHPLFSIGNIPINDTNVVSTTKEEILKNTELKIGLPGCEVFSYVFSIMANGKYWGPTDIRGARLTNEVIDKISNAREPNIKVYIEDIKVKDPDGLIRTLAGTARLKYSQ